MCRRNKSEDGVRHGAELPPLKSRKRSIKAILGRLELESTSIHNQLVESEFWDFGS